MRRPFNSNFTRNSAITSIIPKNVDKKRNRNSHGGDFVDPILLPWQSRIPLHFIASGSNFQSGVGFSLSGCSPNAPPYQARLMEILAGLFSFSSGKTVEKENLPLVKEHFDDEIGRLDDDGGYCWEANRQWFPEKISPEPNSIIEDEMKSDWAQEIWKRILNGEEPLGI